MGRTDRKFKVNRDQKLDSERKSLLKSMEKPVKTIRLKTDYTDLLHQQTR